MAEHRNAKLVRRLFASFGARDFATFQRLVADDAVWHFPGTRSALAGEHRGRDAIAQFLASVMTLSNGTFRLEIRDVTASDDHAVVLFTGHGQRNGKTLFNPTSLVVRIAGGQAVEFSEFVWDLPTVDDFWA